MLLYIFLIFLLTIFFYFRSILRNNDDVNNSFKPKLLITLISINIIGILSFLLPWINLPFIGGKNAIELTSKVFSTIVQEEVLVSMFIFSFLNLICIIGSFLQLKNKVKKSKIILYFEATLGLLISFKGILTVIHFKEIWNSPTDNIIGDALAMSASPGFGLYLIVILGLTQIVTLFTLKN